MATLLVRRWNLADRGLGQQVRFGKGEGVAEALKSPSAMMGLGGVNESGEIGGVQLSDLKT
jgi:hypothetical protein